MQLYRIQAPKSYAMEMCIICADCVYSSIDNTSIIAEFTLEQFGRFSEMLFLNFKATIFAQIINFED
jgi:hypothetical protein